MANADDDWSDLEAADEPSGRQSTNRRARGAPDASAGSTQAPGKRRGHRDDDDFESQQSILKWVRQVPGPLQDVMKKQADQLEGDHGSHQLSEFASGNSDRYSIAVSTVFDDGAWVDMCSFLGMATSPGSVYGGIKVSRLKHTVVQILEDDQASLKIPQLLLLVKAARYVDEEIVADPTGEIEGYFHREIVEQIGPALIEGVGVLLRNVSIFSPVSTRGECYLNVIPHNLQRVFLPNSHAVSSYEAAVQQFNAAREQEVEQEVIEEQESAPESPHAHILQHDTVRHTSTELSYLSQRQVVHRNPPVNSTVASIMSGKNSNADGDNEEPEATGLGRWQWSRLVQKNSSRATASSNSDQDAQRSTKDFDELDPSPAPAPTSRFASLLVSKRSWSSRASASPNEKTRANRYGGEEEEEGGSDVSPQPKPKKRTPTKVTFAPDVVAPLSRLEQSSPSTIGDASKSSAPSMEGTKKMTAASSAVAIEDNEDDDDDDDEDW